MELLLFMRKNRDGEMGIKDGKVQKSDKKIFEDKPNEE